MACIKQVLDTNINNFSCTNFISYNVPETAIILICLPLTGLFTGCFMAFFVGYGIMAHIAGMYRPQSDTVYMETVYPVLRQAN